ncbi:helix-hairpin-helix domain-containing protein [Edwardsiella hoshinae]|uniref:Competence protein ComEA helix-hairpin-helix repeat region n=1 Tax=Edwardsiella hoshinae TaxID=93378 RepID=A0A376DIZ9_9GAMM|nr:helix-hairpin-helix domain-containing protein [Edwardsiella hoshinae]QPR29536.1 helix-hairpin-helix domain-containing protein [Edwardsiella hoshinae]STC90196.1 competence protein ComEA helix-hairpin-helix repeat region [Edwardsiella hoshinae]
MPLFTLLLSSPLWLSLLFFPLPPQAATGVAAATASTPAAETRQSTPPQGARLNINQASAQALAAGMTGVGLDKAKAIVDFRQQHGTFSSLDQLLQVKGIGRALLEKNRSRLAL